MVRGLTRRTFLQTSAAVIVAPSAAHTGQLPARRQYAPHPSQLEAGDFLWPKHPTAIVPYASQTGAAAAGERLRWYEERDRFLRARGGATPDSAVARDRNERLRRLEFEEFRRLYLEDRDGTLPVPMGSVVSVGHVAIVDVVNGAPRIIEAMLDAGVREIEYASWLASRPDDWVWHARLRGRTPADRRRIADASRRQLHKPYDFWNFDLLDDAGFYCSKLAWFAVWHATATALDDEGPVRALWYSPRRMLKSMRLDVLLEPVPYNVVVP